MIEFIRIEHTLEKAKYYRANGVEELSYFYNAGIQLLPNNPFPYIQRTHNPEGVELEDWEVYLMSACDEELADITDNFNVDRVFQDTDGLPQIEWSLTNLTQDYGYEFVYLRIKQGINDFMYTSPFMLSEYESRKTCRFDYAMKSDEKPLSIQLQMYFIQPNSALNLTNYTALSNGRLVNQNITKTDFEIWQTNIIDKYVIEQIRELLGYRYLYCDLQRCGLYDSFDVPRLTGSENYLQVEINLTRNPKDAYDPLYVAPTPPPPPVVTPTIFLSSIVALNEYQIQYNFTLNNFPFTPNAVYVQWSLDNSTWVDGYIKQSSSPQVANIFNYPDNNFYYRVYEPSNMIASNSLQLGQKTITITNITAEPSVFITSGNEYTITYNVAGYTPVVVFEFLGSTDNITWQKMLYGYGNQNPKVVKAPSSTIEFKYFRIKDPNTGIMSNIYNKEL